LAYKAQSLGYYPEVILSGRRVNDNMGNFVSNKIVKLMDQKGITVRGAKALLLGITFKENCPDIRNSKVPDIYNELKSFGMQVDVYDPHAKTNDVKKEFGIKLILKMSQYDVIILTVAHQEFINLDFNALKCKKESVVYDLKSILDINQVDARL
jgi:UDP-N-acetyl-D-galactosamine dehydrogenase